MEYIKKYHMISRYMYELDSRAVIFYDDLIARTCDDQVCQWLQKIGEHKKNQLDIFSGMVTVSSFLLTDINSNVYDTSRLEYWLKSQSPRVYLTSDLETLGRCDNFGSYIKYLIAIEQRVFEFYRTILKRVPMNLAQMESLVQKQKSMLLMLKEIKNRSGQLSNRVRRNQTDSRLVNMAV